MRTQYKIETVDGILGPKNVSREFYSSQDFMDVYNIGLNKAIEKSVAFHNSQYGQDKIDLGISGTRDTFKIFINDILMIHVKISHRHK